MPCAWCTTWPRACSAGEIVAVFPEGTTGDGRDAAALPRQPDPGRDLGRRAGAAGGVALRGRARPARTSLAPLLHGRRHAGGVALAHAGRAARRGAWCATASRSTRRAATGGPGRTTCARRDGCRTALRRAGRGHQSERRNRRRRAAFALEGHHVVDLRRECLSIRRSCGRGGWARGPARSGRWPAAACRGTPSRGRPCA